MNRQDIRILVVDDYPAVMQGISRLLGRAGYTTAMASSGEEALQTLATFPADLVLTDRDMPGLDGVEVCRRIKGNPAFANVLVILSSDTYTGGAEQAEGLESGADGYIAQPIGNRELLARVEAFVRIHRLNRALREKNAELEAALGKVKMLTGLLPICAGCKKIRDGKDYWHQVESYIQKHSEATFTHGLCPDCIKKYYPGLEEEIP